MKPLITEKMPTMKALEVTVIGSAANRLPLPESTNVCVAGLKSAGSSLTWGTTSTVLGGVIYKPLDWPVCLSASRGYTYAQNGWA